MTCEEIEIRVERTQFPSLVRHKIRGEKSKIIGGSISIGKRLLSIAFFFLWERQVIAFRLIQVPLKLYFVWNLCPFLCGVIARNQIRKTNRLIAF
ncbi:hypothetical protein EV426DRAFT_583619 [Tirmania nivea]|nr:hypothetical protein EV426DRAFT_583619 [Tirmania nivea]